MTATDTPLGTAAQLSSYTAAVLAQMASVIQPYVGTRSADYAAHVGAHMRHIIEHYEALANAWKTRGANAQLVCVADYDARERNPLVEADPREAIRRMALIEAILGPDAGLNDSDLSQCVQVHTRGGLEGEHDFCTLSSLARELTFLNSHATHHFAILQGYAKQRGETLGLGVGKAPATVAYEQRLQKSQAAA
jgi:hypothetical protein